MGEATSLTAPLSQSDLDRLGAYLLSDPCGRDAMTVDQVHGLLTAVVCVPAAVPPRVWMRAVFGGELDDSAEADDMTAALMRLNNEIARCLLGGEARSEFEPLIPVVDDEDGDAMALPEGWCNGFLRGMELGSSAWLELVEESAELRSILCPVIALSTRFQEALELEEEDVMGESDRDELLSLLPISVAAVYDYWRSPRPSVRESVRSACGCGSGREPAACCGRGPAQRV